jgi:Mg2+/citrate symporter
MEIASLIITISLILFTTLMFFAMCLGLKEIRRESKFDKTSMELSRLISKSETTEELEASRKLLDTLYIIKTKQ